MILEDIKIYCSNEILQEFSEILERDFKYNSEEINELIEKVLMFMNIVKPLEKLDIVKDDPDDNIVIECAVESGADFIITYDKHLLGISEFRGIKIITPERMVSILDEKEEDN